MGRRVSEKPKRVTIGVRVDENERKLLTECCERSGLTISDILRVGIDAALEVNKRVSCGVDLSSSKDFTGFGFGFGAGCDIDGDLDDLE